MIGQTVSHYKILEKLGEGGMGIVYLAEDTSLKRKVALKFLPASLAEDEVAHKRFLREAQSAAALDHPFICSIHEVAQTDDGQDFISMEFVEGQTLKDRLTDGRLELGETLRLALEMVDALEVAHAKGIVHRDLKPANIMLTPQGHAKIMDFGLAKRIPAEDGHKEEITSALTHTGSTLGTLYYMSPEQVRARPVDTRSDIFSFGIVLYEMCSGVHPFRRPTAAETIGAILTDDPSPLSEHVEGVPETLQETIDQMLVKEQEHRCQSIQEVRAGLSGMISETASPRAGPSKRSATQRRVALPALLAVGLITALIVWSPWEPDTHLPPARPVPLTSYPGEEAWPALSPDGTFVAYAWDGEEPGNFDIYVQLIGSASAEPRRLTTDPAPDFDPTWSPDGGQIAFLRELSGTEHDVLLVPVLGGPETSVTSSKVRPLYTTSAGISWSPSPVEPVIALVDQSAPDESNSIFLLSLETREKQRLTAPPKGAWDDRPRFSPDGSTVAFHRSGPGDKEHICIQSLRGGETRYLASVTSFVRDLDWTSDGSAIVCTLSGMAFKDSHLATVPVAGGEPQRLPFGEGAAFLSIARAGGRLVYERYQLNSDIWRVSGPNAPETSSPSRFVASSTRTEHFPEYSPDGSKIAFVSDRSGGQQIWRCEADGTRLLQLTKLEMAVLGDWSPDGDLIAFAAQKADAETSDIQVVNASGGPTRNLTQDGFSDACPSWSADGRWIFYHSQRADGKWHICKVSAEGGPSEQLTQEGGLFPRLTEAGQVLFWRENRIWSVPRDGGQETLVLDKMIRLFSQWCIWGRYLVYIDQGEEGETSIQKFNLMSGKTTEIQALAEGTEAGHGLTVSPDGRWILYTQVDSSGDLMLVENFR